jgi:hypothetical protein
MSVFQQTVGCGHSKGVSSGDFYDFLIKLPHFWGVEGEKRLHFPVDIQLEAGVSVEIQQEEAWAKRKGRTSCRGRWI